MFGFGRFGSYRFAGKPEPRAYLLGTATVAVSQEFKLYSATKELTTLPTDTPANQPFLGTLSKALRLERMLVGSDGFLSFTETVGELELHNVERDYDYLIRGYAIDGRRVTVKVGDFAALGYAGFATIFDGTAADWNVDKDVLRVSLRDNGYKLEVPAQPITFGGTGGKDGGADLAGKRKPLPLGYVLNVSPPEVDTSVQAYLVSSGPVQDITAVYDQGSPLLRGADYATYSAMVAAAIVPGSYATSLADGAFKLNGAADGLITADVAGDKTGGVFAVTSADIIRRLASLSGAVRDPDGLYLPSFAVVNAAQPAPVGFWLGTDDEMTVADVAKRIMAGVGGWAGFRRNGALEVGIIQAPSGAPDDFFVEADLVAAPERQAMPDALNPPAWRWRVGAQRNWTIQNDALGDVDPARRAFLAEQYRLSEASDAAIKADHPRAQDPAPIEGYFANQADAAAEAARLLAIWRRTWSLYRLVLKTQPLVIELGQVSNITYPRWDLINGRSLRVVALIEDSDTNTVEIQGFG